MKKTANTEKKYQWHEKTICSYYCENSTGRIVGHYSKTNFSDNIYHAMVHGDRLGEYISEKCARDAIEKQVAKNDADEEMYNNSSLGTWGIR